MKKKSLMFRKATLKDIPQCERLVAHSDWQDFIRKYVKKRVNQPDKYLYVVCKNEKILGIGCVTVLPEEMAWLEGIRVHDNYYQQGIGTALFGHGVDYAQKNGFTRVLFSTTYYNKGAINIGRTLGFDRIADFDVVSGNPLPMRVHHKEPGKEISLDKAFKILKSIQQGPHHELCIGFNKVYPFSPELCEKENVHFYGTTKTIVLETDVNLEFFKESIRDVVVYGLKDVRVLLEDVIRRAKRNACTRVRVLGSSTSIHYGLELGFTYFMGERFGLAIFKKEL